MDHSTTVLTWNFPLLHLGLVDFELIAALHHQSIIPHLDAVYLRTSFAYSEPFEDSPKLESHPPPTAEGMHRQLYSSTPPDSVTTQGSKYVCHNTNKTVTNQKSCGMNCYRHIPSCLTSHPNHSVFSPRRLSSFLLWTYLLVQYGHRSMGETLKT